MEFLIVFLVLIIPGFIAQVIFSFLSRCSEQALATGLIFDLLILIINIIGLHYIKGIPSLTDVITSMDSMRFLWKYAALSIGVGTILALIFWPLGKWYCLRTRQNN